jgi:hypothetical protein
MTLYLQNNDQYSTKNPNDAVIYLRTTLALKKRAILLTNIADWARTHSIYKFDVFTSTERVSGLTKCVWYRPISQWKTATTTLLAKTPSKIVVRKLMATMTRT